VSRDLWWRLKSYTGICIGKQLFNFFKQSRSCSVSNASAMITPSVITIAWVITYCQYKQRSSVLVYSRKFSHDLKFPWSISDSAGIWWCHSTLLFFSFLTKVWETGVGGGQYLAKVFGPTWMIKIVLSHILQFLSSQTSIEWILIDTTGTPTISQI